MEETLKYLREKMYEILKVPKSFMNQEINSDSDSDRKFAGLIERLRK